MGGMSEELLAVALLATGLQAGVYYAFGVAVVPGLLRGGPRTHVEAFQNINGAIVRPAFLVTFLGAPLLSAAAALAELAAGRPAGWALAAAGLNVAGLAVTATRNIPLNRRLDAAGPPAALPDPAATVTAFAGPWRRWNAARGVASTLSAGCLLLALLGRG
jgi:uncharacterized membrane protein